MNDQKYNELLKLLNEWHIKILELLSDPEHWFTSRGRQLPQFAISSYTSKVIEDAYPELKGNRILYDKVYKELTDYGLTIEGDIHTNMSEDAWKDSRTTELGKEFLDRKNTSHKP